MQKISSNNQVEKRTIWRRIVLFAIIAIFFSFMPVGYAEAHSFWSDLDADTYFYPGNGQMNFYGSHEIKACYPDSNDGPAPTYNCDDPFGFKAKIQPQLYVGVGWANLGSPATSLAKTYPYVKKAIVSKSLFCGPLDAGKTFKIRTRVWGIINMHAIWDSTDPENSLKYLILCPYVGSDQPTNEFGSLTDFYNSALNGQYEVEAE